MLPKIQAQIEGYYEEFYFPAEKDILAAQLKLYAAKASEYGLAPTVEKQKRQSNGDFTAYVDEITSKSIFSSREKIDAFMKNPEPAKLETDPLYGLSVELVGKMRNLSDEQKQLTEDYQKAFRLEVEGLRESKLNPIQYPDANSTLRLTYGKVRSLPADKRNDAKVNYYTTFDGMVKKYKKNDPEFDLPQRLLDLYKAKDYGRYADKKGYMPVNFLTDNDITGGNSGSPVLNGKGELIGIAFDGNIEAMAGDVIFDKELQRTINVDIRYVLWVIDKYAGAKHIVDEMTIVK
jgi:hypothetical protein